MGRLAAAVVGTGSIGRVHLDGYAAAPRDVHVQALCSRSLDRLREMGRNYGVPENRQYTNYVEMLDSEQLDMVSICVPNSLHCSYAEAAIRRGIHTLVEKPLATNLRDARRLSRIAAQSDSKVVVALSQRFNAVNIKAKHLLDAGAIGEPYMIRVRYCHGGPFPGWAQGNWFYDRELAGGGALFDLGIHATDICQYFIGPVESVSATVRTLRKNIAVDDCATMQLEFTGGRCLGYIECGWISGPGFTGIEIYGGDGALLLDSQRGPQLVQGKVGPDGKLKTKRRDLKNCSLDACWPVQMKEWIRYVQGKPVKIALPGIAEGVASLKVVLAAERSSLTGKRVIIK
jgi:predicted dehydrogenase